MKISDVFKDNVTGQEIALGIQAITKDGCDDGVTEYDLAARAINNHDALVEALGNCLNYMEISGESIEGTGAYKAYVAAKGESK